MSFSNAPPKAQMKSFVTESELEDKRKVRQAEWEKVRKADQPLECPEEPSDNRTLYDRLREQKLKEEEEKDEAKKMKNFVRGLEHDEVEFLDYVDDIYTKMEREKMEQERAVLREFKESVAAITSMVPPIPSVSPTSINAKRKDTPGFDFPSKKKTQKDLMASLVRLKRPNSQEDSSTSSETASVKSPTLTGPARASVLVAEYGSSDSE